MVARPHVWVIFVSDRYKKYEYDSKFYNSITDPQGFKFSYVKFTKLESEVFGEVLRLRNIGIELAWNWDKWLQNSDHPYFESGYTILESEKNNYFNL